MMKLVYKLFFWVFIVLTILGILLLGAMKGYFNQAIAHGLEYYLSEENRQVQLQDLSIENNRVKIESLVFISQLGTEVRLKNISLLFDLSELLRSRRIATTIATDSIIAENSAKEKIFSMRLKAEHHLGLLASMNVANIDMDLIDLGLPNKQNLGEAKCRMESGFLANKKVSCHLSIDESNLNFDSEIEYFLGNTQRVKLDSEARNIPIMLYEGLTRLLSKDDTLELLSSYIKNGIIESGKVSLDLDEEFFQTGAIKGKNLNGNFVAKDFEICYDKDFPCLKKVAFDVSLNGPLSTFLIRQGYSSNTPVSDGKVTFEWKGVQDSAIIIKAKAKGSAVDLTDFIPASDLEETKKRGIDLRSLSGTADTNIDILIPLASDIKNTYNVTSTITNARLAILEESVELQSSTLEGKFDGNTVVLGGKGKINGFQSDINYKYDLNKTAGIDHLLNIKLKIEKGIQKLPVLKLNEGSSYLDFEYKRLGGIGHISASSNLKNIDFYIDKVSIHKSLGDKASLSLTGYTDGPSRDLYELNLTGDNNLKIAGKISMRDKGGIVIDLPVVSHKDTMVRANVKMDKKELYASLQGTRLDLSGADMMQFLKKGKALRDSTNINIDIEKVLLKNDILLKGVKMKIKCTKDKCYKGYFDSTVGSKFFKMLLKTFNDREEWVITSNNAGAIFKGLGLYNNMKAGTMILVLDTNRTQLKTDEIVPILDGSFTFKKFAVVDTPFLTRMVSFISLPGFVNFMRNNKDVIFSDLTGKFTYTKNLISITDAYAEGPFFDFTMEGRIDTKKRKVSLKGSVVPSLYGISTLIKQLPVIGKVLSGGRRKGIVSAPYTVEQDY